MTPSSIIAMRHRAWAQVQRASHECKDENRAVCWLLFVGR